ncbi:protein disulfide isomerase, partial [Lasius niger]
NYPLPAITSPGAPTVIRCSYGATVLLRMFPQYSHGALQGFPTMLPQCTHGAPQGVSTVLQRCPSKCFHDAPTVPLRMLPRCFYGAPTVPLRVLPRCSSRCSHGAYVPRCLGPTVLRSHGA